MNLFVYGTLLVPEIWELVTGDIMPDYRTATLSGHRIARVRDGDFPAIVEDTSMPDLVPGHLMLSVPPESLARLDAYEDSFYERVEVTVKTSDGSVAADVYRLPPAMANEILSEDPWTLEWFLDNAFQRYREMLFGK